jgi:class 3 adenylate cyclase
VTEPGLSSINVVASAIDASLLDFGGHTSPDGAITLLLTDVEGGRELPAEVLRDHATIVRQLVAAHDGTVAGQEGDGFMASFASAHSALRCAIELQKAFAASDVRPRVGLHAGFLIADADAFYGRNVVLAARIADRAKGGEILVSETLRDYTSTDPTFRFEDRGKARLKGLLGTHQVHAVEWR